MNQQETTTMAPDEKTGGWKTGCLTGFLSGGVGVVGGVAVALISGYLGFDCFADSQFFIEVFIFPVVGLLAGVITGAAAWLGITLSKGKTSPLVVGGIIYFLFFCILAVIVAAVAKAFSC